MGFAKPSWRFTPREWRHGVPLHDGAKPGPPGRGRGSASRHARSGPVRSERASAAGRPSALTKTWPRWPDSPLPKKQKRLSWVAGDRGGLWARGPVALETTVLLAVPQLSCSDNVVKCISSAVRKPSPSLSRTGCGSLEELLHFSFLVPKGDVATGNQLPGAGRVGDTRQAAVKDARHRGAGAPANWCLVASQWEQNAPLVPRGAGLAVRHPETLAADLLLPQADGPRARPPPSRGPLLSAPDRHVQGGREKGVRGWSRRKTGKELGIQRGLFFPFLRGVGKGVWQKGRWESACDPEALHQSGCLRR